MPTHAQERSCWHKPGLQPCPYLPQALQGRLQPVLPVQSQEPELLPAVQELGHEGRLGLQPPKWHRRSTLCLPHAAAPCSQHRQG